MKLILLTVIIGCLFAVDFSADAQTFESCENNSKCSEGQVCIFLQLLDANVCTCPVGYTNEDGGCNELDPDKQISIKCPKPDLDNSNVCTTSGVGCSDSGCTGNEICCVTADGCTSACILPQCDLPANEKMCTDQNKVCVDNPVLGYECKCPPGYAGDDCKDRAMVDESCDYPTVTVCSEFDIKCEANSECSDDKICCSTGCGTECVDKKDSGGSGGSSGGFSDILRIMLLTQFLNGGGGMTTPRRCSGCPNYCSTLVCPTDVMSICTPICNNGPGQTNCDVHFMDYYERTKYVTDKCFCSAGENPPQGEMCQRMVDTCRNTECANPQGLQCRVSKCSGRCTVYWTDSTWERRTCYSPIQRRRGIFDIFGK